MGRLFGEYELRYLLGVCFAKRFHRLGSPLTRDALASCVKVSSPELVDRLDVGLDAVQVTELVCRRMVRSFTVGDFYLKFNRSEVEAAIDDGRDITVTLKSIDDGGVSRPLYDTDSIGICSATYTVNPKRAHDFAMEQFAKRDAMASAAEEWREKDRVVKWLRSKKATRVALNRGARVWDWARIEIGPGVVSQSGNVVIANLDCDGKPIVIMRPGVSPTRTGALGTVEAYKKFRKRAGYDYAADMVGLDDVDLSELDWIRKGINGRVD